MQAISDKEGAGIHEIKESYLRLYFLCCTKGAHPARVKCLRQVTPKFPALALYNRRGRACLSAEACHRACLGLADMVMSRHGDEARWTNQVALVSQIQYFLPTASHGSESSSEEFSSFFFDSLLKQHNFLRYTWKAVAYKVGEWSPEKNHLALH